MSSNLISSYSILCVTDIKLLNKLRHEATQRITIAICCILITSILSMMYTNELLVTLLNPMKAIHTDLHIEVIHQILNISFETYDKEVINEICITDCMFDYIPTIEVNISVQNMNTAIFIIILNINMLITYVI